MLLIYTIDVGWFDLMKILYLGKFALRMSFVYKTFCQDSATSKRM